MLGFQAKGTLKRLRNHHQILLHFLKKFPSEVTWTELKGVKSFLKKSKQT